MLLEGLFQSKREGTHQVDVSEETVLVPLESERQSDCLDDCCSCLRIVVNRVYEAGQVPLHLLRRCLGKSP